MNQSCRKDKTCFSSKLGTITEKITFLPSGAQCIELEILSKETSVDQNGALVLEKHLFCQGSECKLW